MAVVSMTGFGSAEGAIGPTTLTVEIKTLNSRFLEISTSLPSQFNNLEMAIRGNLQKYFNRGRVTFSVKSQAKQESAQSLVFGKKYSQALAILEAQDLVPKVPQEKQQALFQLALAILSKNLAFEGPADGNDPHESQLLEKLVATAAEAARDSRRREGQKLQDAVSEISRGIEDGTQAIIRLLPDMRETFEERLRQKLASISQEVNLEDPRFALEITLQMERFDCKEELDRMLMHSKELTRLLAQSEAKALGKELDFLAQEMARETSTLGTKVQGTPVSNQARQLRLLVEQLREQVQNIE